MIKHQQFKDFIINNFSENKAIGYISAFIIIPFLLFSAFGYIAHYHWTPDVLSNFKQIPISIFVLSGAIITPVFLAIAESPIRKEVHSLVLFAFEMVIIAIGFSIMGESALIFALIGAMAILFINTLFKSPEWAKPLFIATLGFIFLIVAFAALGILTGIFSMIVHGVDYMFNWDMSWFMTLDTSGIIVGTLFCVIMCLDWKSKIKTSFSEHNQVTA